MRRYTDNEQTIPLIINFSVRPQDQPKVHSSGIIFNCSICVIIALTGQPKPPQPSYQYHQQLQHQQHQPQQHQHQQLQQLQQLQQHQQQLYRGVPSPISIQPSFTLSPMSQINPYLLPAMYSAKQYPTSPLLPSYPDPYKSMYACWSVFS